MAFSFCAALSSESVSRKSLQTRQEEAKGEDVATSNATAAVKTVSFRVNSLTKA